MKRALDLNMDVAEALRDMACVQSSRGRQRGYTLAANAIRNLEAPLDQLVAETGAVLHIPQVGPASARIIAEVMATGRSLTVERAWRRALRGTRSSDAGRAARTS